MWYKKTNYYVGTYNTVDEAVIARDKYRKELQEAT